MIPRHVGLAAIVLHGATAFADPVEITSTTTAGWQTDANPYHDSYGELFEKLNAAAGFGSWRFALRLDTATFISSPTETVDDYTLEKASITHTGHSLEETVGDSYVSFGRGLALSLRKVDELGIDTTLRGAKLLYHEGNLDGTLAVGYANINNVDELTGHNVDDPYDLIGGVQLQIAVSDRIHLGGYASALAFRRPLGLASTPDFTDRMLQVGALFDAPKLTDCYGLYTEAMLQWVSTDPAATDTLAYAVYATATRYLGRATLLFEGKAYGPLTPVKPQLGDPAFDGVVYSSPPTAERVLQQLENPQRDIAGGRLRLDYKVSATMLAYVNVGAFHDWQGYTKPTDVTQIVPGAILDPYVGVEARWNKLGSWAIAAAGYRSVVLEDTGELVRGDGHVEYDVNQSLGGAWSLTLHGLHDERLKHSSPILDETFREGSVDAGFRLRPWIAASAGYDYTTEPTQPKRNYFHGNLAWDFTSSSSVRLFVGSARGGLKCASGVCRVFPPFEGAKVTLTLRF